jgi:hypothetical protein
MTSLLAAAGIRLAVPGANNRAVPQNAASGQSAANQQEAVEIPYW